MTQPTSNVNKLITSIEQRLAFTYDLTLVGTSISHFVSADDLLKQNYEVNHQAGAVVYIPSAEQNEAFVGIFISERILGRLEYEEFQANLDLNYLNDLCILIEEVSHFHLLTQRLTCSQSVTQLELELQAEIDKLLIVASIVHDQTGKHHLSTLQKRIYNESKIVAANFERYWDATKYASQFWSRLSSLVPDTINITSDPIIRAELSRFYQYPQAQKISLIEHPIKQVS